MNPDGWRPRCARPLGLATPQRVDDLGRTGPTWQQARGGRFRRTSPGRFVLSTVDGSIIEQRILEQAVRLPSFPDVVTGLTGWAALRWREAHYFEGVDRVTGETLPVPLALGGWHDLGNDSLIAKSRERLNAGEVELVDGIPCVIAERAVFDEIRRYRDVRRAVIAVEMTVAAGLMTYASFGAYVDTRNGWTGVPYTREVRDLAGGRTMSPPEAEMRLVWKLDAGFDEPLCNEPVFLKAGRLLGYPDLFDPVAGVVGEYGGSNHQETDRRRSDRSREDRFLDEGLSYFEVVTGDLRDRPAVVRRMQRARSQARFLPEAERSWTMEKPSWWVPPDWYMAI